MNRQLTTHRPIFRSLLALSIAAAMPTFAQAQGAGLLEEIVVTAEHREAFVQDTQISISALSSSDIQELGISTGAEIGQIVPNVTITSFIGGRTGFGVNIRGIGNNETLLTYDPAVGMYIDDVLISKNTGSLLDVLDMERIEVLRGPQGTLYGRNTMGGAVNIVTKKPIGQFEGNVSATLGNYGQRDLRGVLNLPLLDADSTLGALNLRVSAATLNRDGIQKNDSTTPGRQRELGTKDRDIVLAQLLWEPVDDLGVMYSYDRTRIDEIPEVPWVTTANPATAIGRTLDPYLAGWGKRPKSIQVDGRGVAETKVDGHSLHLDFSLSDTLGFKSISAWRTMDNYGQGDSDGTPLPRLLTLDDQSYDFFSQEFRLVGSAFDEQLDYSAGFFFMKESGDVVSGTATSGNLSLTLADFDNRNWAFYGQASYALTERMKLIGGIRYTDEDREMGKTARSAAGVATVFPRAKGSFDNVSPMVSVSYNWSDDIMTYAKVSTGFQSGGFNVRDTSPQDFVVGFKEETLMAYEAGIKSTFDNRVRFNATIWYSDYDDKRVNNFNPETLGNTVRNAGVVEIYGAEVELLAHLDEHWQLGVNYGHTKPKYKEYEATLPGGQVVDLSRSSNFPYTPEHDANINLTYEHPLNFAVLRARVDWNYKDEVTFLVAQPERNSAKAYDLWNARLTLDEIAGPGDTTMRVSTWVKNITNEGYWNFGVNLYNTFGFDINSYGEPRTFGVDFTLNF